MAPILSCLPGSLNAFALKLKSTDDISTIRSRAARKLTILGDGAEIALQYLWCDVYYTLEDDDDWEVFLQRHHSSTEVTLLLTSPSIPTSNPSTASISSLGPFSLTGSPHDSGGGSLYSSNSYGRDPLQHQQQQAARKTTSMHLVAASNAGTSKAGGSVRSGRSSVGADTVREGEGNQRNGNGNGNGNGRPKSTVTVAQSIPEHKIKFEEFHNQLGVRTFIGSIGPVENVRMMMKSGHRHCYMSRAFAQQHAFIPKDAAPGFYGFSGITNLGTWPIKVGKKTVEQQVMLVENSYFPIILGRSFMERRGVRTDPLDQTSVVFMDTGEIIPTDLVVVKDAAGEVIPIS